ncbi:hypothetical protein BO83DRAFT_151867 [Aspergillus eucalypticola CBS 122712]|uniref:Uncharacterized protein n=1 Tax=Aspergillus eucalypticola (strain CBS 122712 / IBT 29274) TaxID=1448314 RepID=A0A317UTC4_ASPEC|nr:uncharacterized protein BO83DRAFT_151867 [Aspergillus eucalypticola CBS 122712]PWY63767.1 hypothetical protein BO83DRAFT_151867 [Aspergillus eucalypticola CBS 122712]
MKRRSGGDPAWGSSIRGIPSSPFHPHYYVLAPSILISSRSIRSGLLERVPREPCSSIHYMLILICIHAYHDVT